MSTKVLITDQLLEIRLRDMLQEGRLPPGIERDIRRYAIPQWCNLLFILMGLSTLMSSVVGLMSGNLAMGYGALGPTLSAFFIGIALTIRYKS